MNIEANLKALNIELPDAPAPAANYVPFVLENGLLMISGQISKEGDKLLTGKLGENVSIEEGQAAARACAIAILAQVKMAVNGDWSRVRRLVRLGGFVNATSDFEAHPQVINGASDLMVQVLGEKGRHARAAVGSSSLPFNVSVEIDAIFAIDPA